MTVIRKDTVDLITSSIQSIGVYSAVSICAGLGVYSETYGEGEGLSSIPYACRCRSPRDRVKARASWNLAVGGVDTKEAHS